jgi:hypothetical protein
MQVFISYSSKDGIKCAKTLHSILTRRGHDAYLIDHAICAGQTIWDEIAKEIQNRKLAIFVITASSKESKGQKQEYDLVVTTYKKRMALAEEKSWDIVKDRYPFLLSPKALTFNDNDIEQVCDEISSQLVKAQDKESSIQETEICAEQKSFKKLNEEGLVHSELDKCLQNLSTSYQSQTIIPEAFNVEGITETDEQFVNVGFNYRLPRNWFLTFDETRKVYANEFLFQEFGGNIAFGEKAHLVKKVMETANIAYTEEESDIPERFLAQLENALRTLNALGHKPKVLFPTIAHYLAMHALGRKAQMKYDNEPNSVLRASLVFGVSELKIIEPLGLIPQETILFTEDAISWRVKEQNHGALYADLGNDRLYSKKYVNALAFTTIKCDVNNQGIFLLKNKNSKVGF